MILRDGGMVPRQLLGSGGSRCVRVRVRVRVRVLCVRWGASLSRRRRRQVAAAEPPCEAPARARTQERTRTRIHTPCDVWWVRTSASKSCWHHGTIILSKSCVTF